MSFELQSLKTGDEGTIILAPRSDPAQKSMAQREEHKEMPRLPPSVAYRCEDDQIRVPTRGDEEPKIYRDWQRG